MPFTHSLTLRLASTDAAGVIYFAEQLRLCHEAYEALLDDAGFSLGRVLAEHDWGVPIIHAETDLERPLRVGDQLLIQVAFNRTGDSSFTTSYVVERGGQRVGAASMVHVCIDAATFKKRSLPQPLVNALTARAAPLPT